MNPAHRHRKLLWPMLIVAGIVVIVIGARSGVRRYELLGMATLIENAAGYSIPDIERALQLGADPNVRDEKGRTPLHVAVDNENLRSVELLLSYGADPNVVDNSNLSPMALATKARHKKLALALRDGGAPYTVLEAVQVGDLESLAKFLEEDPELISKTFQKAKVTPQSLLNIAIQSHNYHAVPMLLAHGADVNVVNSLGQTAFMEAVMRSDCPLDLVDLLLQHNPNLDARDKRGQTLMHVVVYSNNVKLIRKIAGLGLDIEAKDSKGLSPLAAAVAYYRGSEIVDVLVQLGASPTVVDSGGLTLLHYAAQNGEAETVEYLLSIGLDINAKDDWGRTPLIVSGNDKVAGILEENGADMNPVDEEGNTPLHVAAMNARYSEVTRLIARGADIDILNNDGLKALDNAPAEILKSLSEQGLIPPQE